MTVTRASVRMGMKDLIAKQVSQFIFTMTVLQISVEQERKKERKKERNVQICCISYLAGIPCPPGKKTDDAQGRCCAFPFTYGGKSYSSCTTVNHNKPWCSFDAVYRGQWANCGKKTRLEGTILE